MATDFLNLRSGVGPGEDNHDDDVKQVQTALNETGFKPIGRDFGAFEVPETETRFFQNDIGLKDDGVILPGGPTEQTMKKELAEKRARDVRTQGGFRTDADIRDPVGAGMFGPNMKVIGNKRRDVLAAEEAVEAVGVPVRNEPSPTHSMEAIALESAITEFQSREPDLEADGTMNPGGPTQARLRQRLQDAGKLAPPPPVPTPAPEADSKQSRTVVEDGTIKVFTSPEAERRVRAAEGGGKTGGDEPRMVTMTDNLDGGAEQVAQANVRQQAMEFKRLEKRLFDVHAMSPKHFRAYLKEIDEKRVSGIIDRMDGGELFKKAEEIKQRGVVLELEQYFPSAEIAETVRRYRAISREAGEMANFVGIGGGGAMSLAGFLRAISEEMPAAQISEGLARQAYNWAITKFTSRGMGAAVFTLGAGAFALSELTDSRAKELLAVLLKRLASGDKEAARQIKILTKPALK